MAMQPTTIDAELLDLEKQFWNAMKDRDAGVAVRLADDPCLVVGPQGIGEVDARAMASMMKSSPYETRRFSLDEKNLHIRSVAKDVAVIAYKVVQDLTVDGKQVSIEAFDSSVWVRKDGEWVCSMHTETLAGDPYGRDRALPQGAVKA
jgi:hypothetical protein